MLGVLSTFTDGWWLESNAQIKIKLKLKLKFELSLAIIESSLINLDQVSPNQAA